MLLTVFLGSQLIFAQTSTVTTTPQKKLPSQQRLYKHNPPKAGLEKKTPRHTTTTPSEIYKACLGKEVRRLTAEMRAKKKEALNEFKIAYRNSTTTEAKSKAKENYSQTIKDINKWFNAEVRKAKEMCRGLRKSTSTPASTPTTTSQE